MIAKRMEKLVCPRGGKIVPSARHSWNLSRRSGMREKFKKS